MFEEIRYILNFMYDASKGMLIFFSIGIGIASAIKTFKLDSLLSKAFEGKKGLAIPIATAAGSLSPLCSCGVIPAIAALLASGVPLAPIMAFWVTSPLMSPEKFVLTYGVLGEGLAIARLLTTLSIGLVAGYFTLYLSNKGLLENQILRDFGSSAKQVAASREELEKGLTKGDLITVRMMQFLINFKDMAIFVGKFILIAFFLEAIISRYVSMDWIGSVLGNSNPLGPVIAAFIGIPAYISGISSVPLIRVLMESGMDQGTALTFMISGAATSIPAMVAVFSIVKRKTFFIYVATSMIGAIIAGYVYRLF